MLGTVGVGAVDGLLVVVVWVKYTARQCESMHLMMMMMMMVSLLEACAQSSTLCTCSCFSAMLTVMPPPSSLHTPGSWPRSATVPGAASTQTLHPSCAVGGNAEGSSTSCRAAASQQVSWRTAVDGSCELKTPETPPNDEATLSTYSIHIIQEY